MSGGANVDRGRGPIIVVVAGLALIGGAALVFFSLHVETRTLYADVSCTKMACTREAPCCNSCQHDGWRSEHPVYSGAQGLFGELPRFAADGCGRVEAVLVARGIEVDRKFYVITYEERRPGKPVK